MTPLDATLLTGRLILAAVFAVAGVAKLLDPKGVEETLPGFGVPARLAAPLGRALPLLELSVAAALIPRTTAWWGGFGALGLLLVFTAVVARSLMRGERPDCRCFGQLRAAPVGWPTLVRNGLLVSLATLVVGAGWSGPGPSVIGWVVEVPATSRPAALFGFAAVVLLVGVIALLIVVLVRLGTVLHRFTDLEVRLDELTGGAAQRPEAPAPDRGLPVGALAPAFALPDLDGQTRQLSGYLAERRPVLLFFVASECQPCEALAPKIAGWQRERADAVTMVLVSTGSAADNRAKFPGVASGRVLLQAGNAVADAYAASWTPAAVLLAPTGRLASPVSYGDAEISALVAQAGALAVASENGRERRGSLPIAGHGPRRLGQDAPSVTLPDLDGHTVDLRDYRGRDTLVVFWSPSCPHCQELADDLRRWEAEPPRGAPRLLLVSSGSEDANRALGFRSSIVLDESFKVGKTFGVDGTPSAVLVDAEGRIASSVGTGARNVLALAGVLPVIEAP